MAEVPVLHTRCFPNENDLGLSRNPHSRPPDVILSTPSDSCIPL